MESDFRVLVRDDEADGTAAAKEVVACRVLDFLRSEAREMF